MNTMEQELAQKKENDSLAEALDRVFELQAALKEMDELLETRGGKVSVGELREIIGRVL
jgi:hypothetical protein